MDYQLIITYLIFSFLNFFLESENESPLIFEDDQLYLVLELTHGGLDLEAFEFNNSRETVSIFKQVN